MTNIAEILKGCPRGTKLYSPVCGECELIDIDSIFIKVINNNRHNFLFYHSGRYLESIGECLLFPSKENRDWSKFGKLKFKKGDFVVTEEGGVLMIYSDEKRGYYVLLDKHNTKLHLQPYGEVRLATEEEKQKLLKDIDKNGYIWDEEKLELRKKELEIYPGEYYTCIKDFKHNGHDVLKVGKTYRGSDSSCHCVLGEENRLFIVGHDTKNAAEYLRFSTIDEIRSFIKEKNCPKFQPFDKVLVRDSINDIWCANLFSHELNSSY